MQQACFAGENCHREACPQVEAARIGLDPLAIGVDHPDAITRRRRLWTQLQSLPMPGMPLGDIPLGQQLGQTTAMMIERNLNISPTLIIRPGFRFNVVVVKDLTFSKPYRSFDY